MRLSPFFKPAVNLNLIAQLVFPIVMLELFKYTNQ